jgi:hypothetical protein
VLGGGTFRRFFPWPENRKQYVIYHGLDCFDCDWECKFAEKHCLHLVRPPDVLRYFDEIMDSEGVGHERNLNPEEKKYCAAWRRWKDDPVYLDF